MPVNSTVSLIDPALTVVSVRPTLHSLPSEVATSVSSAAPPVTVTAAMSFSPSVNVLAESPPIRSSRSTPANAKDVAPTESVDPASEKSASCCTMTVSVSAFVAVVSRPPTNVIVAVGPAELSLATSSRKRSSFVVPVMRMPPSAASAFEADETIVSVSFVSTRRNELLPVSKVRVRSRRSPAVA